MPTTTTARHLPATGTTQSGSSATADFVIGLMLAAVFPAVFWIAVIAAVAGFFGHELARADLLLAGGGIAGFLGVFFVAIYNRAT
jgi:hypothetical protein